MENSKEITVQHSFQEMEKMAVAIAKSGLFGMKTTEQALALMLVAQAEGRHPGRVATDYHIIQGRPSLKADTMLARFQEAGGGVQWLAYTDTKVEAQFYHPQGGKITISWTIEQAKAAGLTGKDVWKSYPRAMLRARVISEGIRTVFPAVLAGMYTPEEVADFSAEPKNITPEREPTEPAAPKKGKAPNVEPVDEAEVVVATPQAPAAEPEKASPPPPPAPPANGRTAKIREIFTASGKLGQTPDQMKQTIGEILGMNRPIRESAEIPTDALQTVLASFAAMLAAKEAK